MARRQWTLLVVSDDQVRQIKITRELVRATIAGALLGLSLLLSLGASFMLNGSSDVRVERLNKRNQLLQAEVVQIRDQVRTLEGTLAQLSEKDQQYRLMAGLDPLDEDVKKAGVGGPGVTVETKPLWAVDRRAGQLAFSTASDLSSLVRRARLLTSSWTEAEETLTRKHAELAATPSVLPTNGSLSSVFTSSRWHPLLHRARPHQGIDITAPVGTPIIAAAKGRVVKATRDGDYGLVVEIDHGYGYLTRYAHASRLHVRRGQLVERGERIADVGRTGLAVGTHLHYEVLVNGKAVNPRRFILDNGPIKD